MNRLLASTALLLASLVHAQNLVPNGSFEEHDTCPSPYFGYELYATGWMNLHTHSADYFNACDTSGVVGVPSSQFGYQYAADGDAYVGMATSAIGGASWYREIVGIQLTQSLQPGVPICLSFKMAVGGFGSWSGNSSYHTCKGIGLKFFSVLPDDWHSYLYPNSSALHLEVVPTDTAIWYSIAGTYIPDSAYTYVLVGNFYADSLSQVTLLDSSGFGGAEPSYAFVDDVRVSFELNYCTLDLNVADRSDQAPLAYPVPCGNVLHVRLSRHTQGRVHYVLRDMAGRSVQEGSSVGSDDEVLIQTESLPDGAYLLQLSATQENWSPISVVHVSP